MQNLPLALIILNVLHSAFRLKPVPEQTREKFQEKIKSFVYNHDTHD